MGNTVNFLISWLPAILLITSLAWGIVIGLIRGFRKSAILTIHALAAAVICLIAYLIIINMKGLDAWAYNLINSISGGSFAETLDVSPNCKTLTDVLVEFIPKNMDFGSGMALVFEDNGAYLATLVDLCYHMIFALVFYIIYVGLLFFLYIIYLIFYPERRYKRKIKEKYRNAESTKDYTKKPLFGCLIGGARSLVEYLVFISFVGILFFTLAGGLGEKKYEDYDFGDENTNEIYEVYTAIGSYGSSGIFKVLNAVKDSNDFPYYLYAADLVFQGGLKDENRQINTNISMAREFGAYVGFSRDTFNLLLKYDEDNKIKESIMGESDVDLMEVASEIMSKPEFQEEFTAIIDKFESEEYFINFSLSLVDSIVEHRNDLDFFADMDEQTMELFDIMFDGENKITVSSLLSKNDAKVLLNTCIRMLSAGSEYNDLENEEEKSLRKTLSYCKVIIPEIEKLSIFEDGERKNNLNAVLKELYDYLASKLVEEDNSNTSLSTKLMKMSNTTIDDVDWIAELKGLLDISLSIVDLYDRIYSPDKEIVDIIFDMFTGDNAAANEADFDNITNVLSSSKLAGVVLSMSFVNDTIEEALGGMIEGFELIPNIQYSNDSDSKGEIYYLLTTIKHLVKNDAKDIFTSLTAEDVTVEDMLNSIEKFIEVLETKVEGDYTLLDQMLKSDLLSYTLSSIMMNITLGDDTMKLYIPDDIVYNIRETNDTQYKAIKTEDLVNLVSTLPDIIDIIKPVNGSDELDIAAILKNESLPNSLKSSVILEGTVSNLAISMLGDFDLITIPNSLGTVENWLSTEEEDGEILKIVNGINASGIDLNTLMNGDESATNDILGLVLGLNDLAENSSETKLDLLYKSKLLRATLAVQIDSALKDLIDAKVLDSTLVKYQTDDEYKDIYYKQAEIEGVIDSINVLGIESLDSEAFNADVLSEKVLTLNESVAEGSSKTKLDALYSSAIIKYVLADALDSALTDEIIALDVRDSDAIKEKETLTSIVDSTQVTSLYYEKNEIKGVIAALNELEINTLDDSSMNADTISGKVLELNSTSITDSASTKLDVLYSSTLIKAVLAETLDSILTSEIVSLDVRDSSLVKSNEVFVNLNTSTSVNKAYYNKTEISYIIYSLEELDITEFNEGSIDADTISDKVLDLNNTAATDFASTKLDVLYNSAIIKYILSDALDNALTDEIISLDVRDSSLVKSSETLQNINTSASVTAVYYNKSEISNIIYSLEELDITEFNEGSIDVDTISDKVLDLNNTAATDSELTKLDVLYSSAIIKYMLSDALDDNLSTDGLGIHEDVINSIKANNEIPACYYYKQEEISLLLAAFGENGLGIDDFDEITNADADIIIESDLNEVPEGQTKSRLEVVYASNLVKDIITTKLDEALINNEYIVVDPQAKGIVFNETIKFYNQDEIAILLEFMNKHVSSEFGAIDLATLTLDSNDTDLIVGSKILYATTSKYIITNDALVVPGICVSTNNSINLISEEAEMRAMLNAIITICSGNINDVNLSLSSQSIELLCASEILRATISDKLVNNDAIIVPADTKDTKFIDITVINAIELEALLNAVLNGLNVSDVDQFDSSVIRIPEAEELTALIASSIMRATITKNIKASDGTNDLSLYVENNSLYVEKTEDITGDEILILSQAEILSIVDAIKVINGSQNDKFEITINISVLLAIDIDAAYEVLESSMVHLLISTFLVNFNNNLASILQYEYTALQKDVYNVNTLLSTNPYVVMSVEDIMGLLDHIRTIL